MDSNCLACQIASVDKLDLNPMTGSAPTVHSRASRDIHGKEFQRRILEVAERLAVARAVLSEISGFGSTGPSW